MRAARRAPVAPLWRRPGRSGAGVHSHGRGAGELAPHPGVAPSCSSSTSRSTGSASPTGSPCCCRSDGGRILRIKGLLNVAGDPLPRVLQCVQHSVYPASSLPAWRDSAPYDDRRSRLVFIVRELAEDEVISILGSFTGQPAAPHGLKGRIRRRPRPSSGPAACVAVPRPARFTQSQRALHWRRCSPRPPPRTPTWCDARGGGRSRSRRSRG